jgi:hypothetical protein
MWGTVEGFLQRNFGTANGLANFFGSAGARGDYIGYDATGRTLNIRGLSRPRIVRISLGDEVQT